MVKKSTVLTNDYAQVLADIKHEIQTAQVKAILAVNKELLRLYWSIGKKIVEKQQAEGWGAKVIEQLAKDLQNAFPGLGGFSRSNIFSMRAFYQAYQAFQQPAGLIVQQLVGQLEDSVIFTIPWGHNVVLLAKLNNLDQRLWYAQKAVENGWSRSMLEMQIRSNLYQRQGKAINNFSQTLPAPQSDMAQQSFKDPYVFDFLTLHADYNERDVEQGLISHIQKFLLELGQGFAFIGKQYHLNIDGDDYYLDLLFYHVKLRCYIVVELKSVPFKPEFAGKLNFYLSAVDDLLKTPEDKPTIGLLLCNSKKNFTVEYALRDINKPIGVASYAAQLVESLPSNLKGSLPTVEEIEAELSKEALQSSYHTGELKE